MSARSVERPRPRGQEGVRPGRLQRADQERHDHRRHAHPRVAADDPATPSSRAPPSILASHLGRPKGKPNSGVLAASRSPRGWRSCSGGRWSSPRTASASRRSRRSEQAGTRWRRPAREPALPRRGREERPGVRAGARGARRRLRQRRVRLGAPRARVHRGHRPSSSRRPPPAC